MYNVKPNSCDVFAFQAVEEGRPLLWKGCSQIPCGFVRPHIACCGSTVYVGGGSTGKVETSRTVYRYSSIDNVWSSLPICPYYTFALAVVKGCVTGSLLNFPVKLFISGIWNTLHLCVLSVIGHKSLQFPPVMIFYTK